MDLQEVLGPIGLVEDAVTSLIHLAAPQVLEEELEWRLFTCVHFLRYVLETYEGPDLAARLLSYEAVLPFAERRVWKLYLDNYGVIDTSGLRPASTTSVVVKFLDALVDTRAAAPYVNPLDQPNAGVGRYGYGSSGAR